MQCIPTKIIRVSFFQNIPFQRDYTPPDTKRDERSTNIINNFFSSLSTGEWCKVAKKEDNFEVEKQKRIQNLENEKGSKKIVRCEVFLTFQDTLFPLTAS